MPCILKFSDVVCTALTSCLLAADEYDELWLAYENFSKLKFSTMAIKDLIYAISGAQVGRV